MVIKFLGTGSAFTLDNYQTNLLIEKNGKHLLLDAGTDIRFSLNKANATYKNIDSVYISHLHADHAGGLEYLGFCSFFDPAKDKITLISQSEIIKEGWKHTWSGGMKSYQGKVLALDDYFDVQMIPKNGKFVFEDIVCQLVQSVHIMDGFAIVPTYGLIISLPDGKKIYWTADTQFNPNQIMDFYKMADVIIQDCENTPYKSGVHAHVDDLLTLPDDIKKKMKLVHYQGPPVLLRDKVVSSGMSVMTQGSFLNFDD